ncbi:MAG: L-threonine 3-dehydrogenase [Ardenticatenia bacterium]|nr:L-threonine 3-dehydrogenase [Ardenticatenia bacterium]
MRALAKVRPGPGLELIEVDVPRPGPDDVLIRVTATSICGTDLHIYTWDSWSQHRIKPPLILGHEFAGEIVEVGRHVKHLKPGMAVSAEGHIVDHTCPACRAGQPHLCQNVQVIGIDRPGSFAEYLAVPAENVWVNSPELPPEIASLQDPFGNAVHTAHAFDLTGHHVLVTGCGPIGLMVIPVARVLGARLIVATDINSRRLELARLMGADVTLNPAQDHVVEAVRDLTGGGADVVLEMSGAPEAIRQGLEALRPGGHMAALGLTNRPPSLDWNELIVIKGITVKGIYGRRLWETWHHMRGLLESGAVHLAPLITHRLPLEAYEEAFARLMAPGEDIVAKIIMFP